MFPYSQTACTVAMFGSPLTLNNAQRTPAPSTAFLGAAARASDFPTTIKARFPSEAAAGASSLIVPVPNTIRLAVANSKRMRAGYSQPDAWGNTLCKIVRVLGSIISGSAAAFQRL